MKRQDKIVKAVEQWHNLAERDLTAAEQGLEAHRVLTDTICFHCQQAAEKYLKSFLVFHQVDFPKSHNLVTIINLCLTIDKSFEEIIDDADILTDYATEIRYPDDWYEPSMEETKKALKIAINIKNFVLKKIGV